MDDLRIIGENNIVEILEVKGLFIDIFDDVLSLLYLKREGLTTKEILTQHPTVSYNHLYRFLTRLVTLEIVKPEEDNKYVFTQKGIDIYKVVSQLELSPEQMRLLGKKNTLHTLKTLFKNSFSWNDLNKALYIGHSSMKNALDTLIVANLIKKDNEGYTITDEGKTLITSLQECYQKKYTPVFEIQAKFSIKTSEKTVLLDIIKDRFSPEEMVIQQDYYIRPGTGAGTHTGSESYLRYRRESLEKPSIKSPPNHYLTWLQINNRYRNGNTWILNRSREEIHVEYPSIIYFIEYLGARIVKKITKRRDTYKNQDLAFHFDEILSSNQQDVIFVEIKSKAWDAAENTYKVELINNYFEEMRAAVPVKSIEQPYFDFL